MIPSNPRTFGVSRAGNSRPDGDSHSASGRAFLPTAVNHAPQPLTVQTDEGAPMQSRRSPHSLHSVHGAN